MKRIIGLFVFLASPCNAYNQDNTFLDCPYKLIDRWENKYTYSGTHHFMISPSGEIWKFQHGEYINLCDGGRKDVFEGQKLYERSPGACGSLPDKYVVGYTEYLASKTTKYLVVIHRYDQTYAGNIDEYELKVSDPRPPSDYFAVRNAKSAQRIQGKCEIGEDRTLQRKF